jgi:branched-subunit amino acid aminotransferase/4-amino-4-deoxychorismate lyase
MHPIEHNYLDEKNFINEGYGFNIFFVEGKNIYTPNSKNILCGVTREKIIGVAKKTGFIIKEKDISLKDVEKFNESFVTATGWGICPVKSLNKKNFIDFGNQNNTTQKIQNEFSKIVKTDIVKQYLNFLN